MGESNIHKEEKFEKKMVQVPWIFYNQFHLKYKIIDMHIFLRNYSQPYKKQVKHLNTQIHI